MEGHLSNGTNISGEVPELSPDPLLLPTCHACRSITEEQSLLWSSYPRSSANTQEYSRTILETFSKIRMCKVRRTQREVWVQTRDSERPSPSMGKGTRDARKDAESFCNMAEASFLFLVPGRWLLQLHILIHSSLPSVPSSPPHAPIKQVNIPRCQFADWYGGTPGERFGGGVAICVPAPKSSLPAAVDWGPETELPTTVLKQDQLLSLWWPCKEQC